MVLRLVLYLGDTGRAADLVRAAAYPTAPIRKLKADENDILNGTCRDWLIAFEILTLILCHSEAQEVRNERALFVYRRVQDKLTGTSCLYVLWSLR